MEYGDKIVLEHIEVRPGVYHVTSDSAFDLAMTFLRPQEFYESDNSKIRGKQFNMIEYIRWYTKRSSCSSFNYAGDWGGFNVPSTAVIGSVYAVLHKEDCNIYDKAMYDLCEEIGKKSPVFYLIGTMNKNSEVHRLIDHMNNGVLDHELAHAFYYINQDYKKACDELIASMSDVTKKRIYKELKNLGYATQVWEDELQAYMVAGIEGLNGLIRVMKITKELATEMLKSGNEVLVAAAKEAYQELGKSNFEIACEKLGIEPIIPDGLEKIIEVANEGWKPDFENEGEYKYAPYFTMRGGQVFDDVDYWDTAACVPATSLFKSRELAEKIALEIKSCTDKCFLDYEN